MAGERGLTLTSSHSGSRSRRTWQDGRTSLYAASLDGHTVVVDRLIASGAVVDAATKVTGRAPRSRHTHARTGPYAEAVSRLTAALARHAPLPPRPFCAALQLARAARSRECGCAAADADDGSARIVWTRGPHARTHPPAPRRRARPSPRPLVPYPRCPQTGYTPLLIASEGGHLEAVDRLIAARADVNAKDEVGPGAIETS